MTKIIQYKITLLQPVLVTALEGDPNSAISHDYLPGSVLRGAFIGQYLREKTHDFDLAVDPNARRLFIDGTTRYLNGYLELNGQRSLPVPRTWMVKKRTKSPITDVALSVRADTDQPTDDIKTSDSDKENVKQESLKGFWGVSLGESQTDGKAKNPKRHVNVHTYRVNRIKGRPMGGDDGTVYRYDALAANQTFIAYIICEDGDAEILKKLICEMESGSHLGGARTAGYGQVTFEEVKSIDSLEEGKTGKNKIGRTIITLTSDVIVRDKYGQVRADCETLCYALGERLDITLPPPLTEYTSISTTMIGGFNRKWGLPLPQTPAIEKGSVLVFDSLSLKTEQIQALTIQGVGERRAEGFGQVIVNWQQKAHLTQPEVSHSEPNKDEKSSIAKALSTYSSNPLLQRFALTLAERKIIGQAQEKKLKKIAPKSQLSRLRAEVRQSLYSEKPSMIGIAEYLKDIEGKYADKKLREMKIDSKDFKTYVEDLCADDGRSAIDLNAETWEYAALEDQSDRLKLQLLDAILAICLKHTVKEVKNG